jgi:hypothetical protein
MKLTEIKNQAFEMSYMANSYEVKLLARLVQQLCDHVEEIEDAQEQIEEPEETRFTILLVKALAEMGDTQERLFTLWDLAKMARQVGVYKEVIGTVEDGCKLTEKEDKVKGVDRGCMYQGQSAAFGMRMRKQVGTVRTINGKQVLFGKRGENRKASYTVSVSKSSSPNVLAHPRGQEEPENQTGCFPASDAAPCSMSSCSVDGRGE